MKTIRIACDTKDTIPLDQLTPFQGDLKSLSTENYAKLKTEILNTGFAFPIFAWRDEKGDAKILGGHQRIRTLTSMRSEGYFIPPVPVVFIEAKDYAEAKRRILQDVSQYGAIETQGLYEFATDAGLSLPDLEAFDLPEIDMKSFGDEFFKDTPTIDESKEDEIPESAPARVKRGEIWQLGRHRLACIDSTSAEEVARLMGGEKADMVFTDPPYGIGVVGQGGLIGKAVLAAQGSYRPVAGDESTGVARAAIALMLEMEPETMIVWGGNYYASSLPDSQRWIVWDKQRPEGTTFSDVELAWTNKDGALKKYAFLWHGMMQAGSREKRVHPTQKPVGLITKIFDDYPAESVLDLFGGSGSTLIACEKTGRTCYMAEIDPLYCDVIIERWQQLTGGVAEKIK